jgi:type IV secretory pathway TraG/TraD family ATPase VirD4
MSVVHGWLRSGIDGLDEPRQILSTNYAHAASDSIAGIQALDERPRSLMLMSAAQLVDAYRFPSVNAFDQPDFRPDELLERGTLYVVAPESEQDLLAPIIGGLLGSVLRTWEQRAAADPRHHGPRLRILADEAAHLAPLGKLPTYLAVSAGWGVRWCLVYQSLSQLEHRYGREADAVLGNTLCKLFLGPIQDESTRRYLSDLLDEETVTAASWSSSPFGSSGASRHERQAAKVSAQPLMQLGKGQAVLVHGRDLPAVAYLPASWERSR